MNIAPNRKIIRIGIPLAVAVLGFVVWFAFGSTSSRIFNPDGSITVGTDQERSANSLQKNLIERDTDGDGLYDWEEALWQTDANNPDTDGDGTSDGEEVDTGRNPTVAGPDDSLAVSPASDDSATESAALTATDRVARGTFLTYLELKQSGGFDAATQGELIEKIAGDAVDAVQYTRYSASDITAVPQPTTEDYVRYRKEWESAVRQLFTVTEDELVLLTRAFEDDDSAALEEIAAAAATYRSVVSLLLKMRVPVEAIEVHLAVTNALSDIATTVDGMRLIQQDPVLAFGYIGAYEDQSDALDRAFRALNTYLANIPSS